MRIRYLKPDFFKDEHIAELEFWVRLLFAGLWCMADKEGKLEDSDKRIKVELFPYDKLDIETGLALLAKYKTGKNRPFILRYEISGKKYIKILSWEEHQKPHHTEKDSTIPNPSKEILDTIYISIKGKQHDASAPLSNGDLTVKQRLKGNLPNETSIPDVLKGLELYEKDAKLCDKIQQNISAWSLAYPGVDISGAIKQAHAWEVSHPKQRKIDRISYLQRWLAKEQDNYRPPDSRSTGYRNTKLSPHHPKAAPGKYDNYGKPKPEPGKPQEEKDDGEFSKEDPNQKF
jgi:hypothetical protein